MEDVFGVNWGEVALRLYLALCQVTNKGQV